MFPTYVEHPLNLKFEGQDSDEKILLLLRAHPITNIPWIFFSLLLFAVPFIAPKVLFLAGIDFILLPQTFQIILLIINYLVLLGIAFEGFLYWYFNVTLVTNKKVIDVDFANILYKSVELAPLSKIEEADSTTAGVFGSLFNFGNVTIQTAGAKVAIEMKNIPRPPVVADMILDLAGRPHTHT